MMGKLDDNKSTVFYMTLQKGSGFYPAGPEYGDEGVFEVSLFDNQSYSSMLLDYFEMFECKFKLLVKKNFKDLKAPLHHEEQNGNYDFGKVKGLIDPVITPKQNYGIKKNVVLSGSVNHIWNNDNCYFTSIRQMASTRKMAELSYYLQEIRRESIIISPKTNYWLFGPDILPDSNLFVKLTDKEFLFTHEQYDMWSVNIPLMFNA
jgi:hypothetical protein